MLTRPFLPLLLLNLASIALAAPISLTAPPFPNFIPDTGQLRRPRSSRRRAIPDTDGTVVTAQNGIIISEQVAGGAVDVESVSSEIPHGTAL
ncbi:hypothetical protein B0H13DRAFT_2318429 [Mycena leptocephala]|nr:hypothetical protein B0H13DRAFT_2318429 [Mycena leptocephala]